MKETAERFSAQKREVDVMKLSSLSRGVLLASTIVAGLAALAPLPASAQDRALVIARSFELDTLDPARAFCDTCQIYLSNTYESLIGLAPDNKSLTPRLAISWEANADQTQFTFKLDPEALFSDGSPVESKDVKWSFERLKNVKGNGSFLMDGVKSIETPDAHTVVITMEKPNSEFLGVLTAPYAGVVNSDVAAPNGASAAEDAGSTDTAEPWFLANSAGSGPYMLTSYKPDDELRLVANPHYKRTPVGVKEVVLKHTKDAVAQAQMLENGAADVAMQVDPDTAKRLPADKVTVNVVPSFNFLYVVLSPGAKGSTVKLTPQVREAIGLALDYDGIIDFTVGGAGKPQAAPIPNGFPGTEGLPLPKQDLAKAKELLAAAGYPDGFEIDATFPNMNIYGVDLSLLMQKVQQDLAQVGIKALLSPVEFSVWRDRIRGDGIPMSAAFYAPDYFGSAQYVQFFGMMEGTVWWGRAGGKNDPSMTNPREGELLEQALASGGDEAARIYHEIGLEMIKDRIVLPVVSPDMVLAHAADVTGVRYSACCNLPLDEIARK